MDCQNEKKADQDETIQEIEIHENQDHHDNEVRSYKDGFVIDNMQPFIKEDQERGEWRKYGAFLNHF